MKICAISDTHGKENLLSIPKCDVLLCAGDYDVQTEWDLDRLNFWFGTLKNNGVKNIVFIGGNHDRALESSNKKHTDDIFTNAIYLQDSSVTIDNIKIYGSPHSPKFMSWSFMYERCSKEASEIWKRIPKDTDILLTHTMPYGILDLNSNGYHCGCDVLAREVFNKNIKIQIGGHLHENFGQSIIKNGIDFYNVSVLNQHYELVNEPTIIDYV
ncbi:MAG: metallophosphoesterase [Novosphingobium sp.]|nr:metallophosphoesterase [Novosphingobium sp.]